MRNLMKLTKDHIIECQIIKKGTEVTIKEDTKFDYMMLSRLKQDVDYYLGNGGKSPRVLYYKDEKEHYGAMVDLFNKIPQTPEWLSKYRLKRLKIF